VKEDHDLPDLHPFLPGIGDPFPAFWPDTIDGLQVGGVVANNPKYFRAEVSDQLFRQDGANPFHEAAGKVPFNTFARGWRNGFQGPGLELETVLLVPNPPAFRGEPLPSAHGRQGAKDRHLVPLATDLYSEYGEPAFFIEEGDPLYESGDLF